MLDKNSDFAVIGMACRFPGAENYNQYWENLMQGKNCVVEIPEDRWKWQDYFGDPKTETNKTTIKWGGFITDIDKFDPLFFNISPKEASYIDPQHRLFLQTALHSIEDAGYSVESLAGKKIGVYAGVSKNDYTEMMREWRDEIAPFISTGTVHSILANRVSFLFDLHGRSEAIDTACSSSLVALHNAMRDISNGECEAALVGGVNALLTPTIFISHSKSGMLSPDGQCKTFDAEANGYVRGEGVGVLFIKPLSKALAAGDHIHAIIKSSAVNHGGRANFLTSPTVEAQADVIGSAQEKAKINPNTVSYIEVHGTGTPLGDPIEINALKKAFTPKNGNLTTKSENGDGYCALSAVKTNIGHLESASGIAGIIKVILAMQNKQIPGLQNFNKLNPYINLEQSPFYIADKNIHWDPPLKANGEYVPRRAGVSSFGMGGVNAHVILEEAPTGPASHFAPEENLAKLILISSKNREGLRCHVNNLLDYLTKPSKFETPRLSDIAYTLQVGRDQYGERLALIANNKEQFTQQLNHYLDGKGHLAQCFVGSVIFQKGEKPQTIKALRNMDLVAIAETWVKGAKLDWSDYYTDENRPLRVPLPTYVFTKKRCWFNQELSPPLNNQDAQTMTRLNNDKDLEMPKFNFKKTLRPNDFYIQDHIVQGEKMLPGVAYLELARAAHAQLENGNKVNKLRNIYWVSPLIVKDHEVNVGVKFTDKKPESTQQENLTAYQVIVNDSLHGKGELGYSDFKDSTLSPLDINAIKKKCRGYIQQSSLYQLFASNGLSYGPSFQALKKCYYNDKKILSELVLPASIVSSFDEFVLHPSLMDGAFQTIVALSLLGANRRDQQYVPFFLESVEIHKPLTQHCYVFAHTCDDLPINSMEIKFDAVICNAEGEVLVKINGLTKRAIDLKSSKKNQPKIINDIQKPKVRENSKIDIYYRSTWLRSALPEKPEPLDGLIMFGHEHMLEQSDAISGIKGPVFLIIPGIEYRVINDKQIQVNPKDPQDYLKMVEYLKDAGVNFKHILYMWGFDFGQEPVGDPDDHSVNAILLLTKAIISKRAYKSVKLIYYHYRTDKELNPCHALVGGFARTLAYENPKMRFYTLGFDSRNIDDVIRLSIKEFLFENNNKLQEIRYSEGTRFERKIMGIDDQRLQALDTNALLRTNGVYLITGGAGGLGYLFAKYLSEKYQATILLIGRSKLNSQIEEKIKSIQSYGGKCAYFSADITKIDELRRVYREIQISHGMIHGVIHAAGIIEDAYILLKKEDSFCRVIDTKVKGVINLDLVTRDEKLDFFVMFSSIAALMPNQGQSDYAAANSFLDSFAETRNQLTETHQRSGLSLSINWPLWAQGGMRVTPEEEAHLLHEFGMKPLEETLGIDIFENALKLAANPSPSNPLNQIVAIDGDKEKIAHCLGIDHQENIQPELKHLNKIVRQGAEMNGNNKHDIENEVKKQFSVLFSIAIENITIDLRMRELSLDSHSMVSIVRHFNSLYGIDLKPTLFFEIDTISEFIRFIQEQCGENQAPTIARHNRSLIDLDDSKPSQMKFQRRFSVSEFYLKDHVVEGQYNMPGACYIEMARQAGDLAFGDGAVIKLSNNYWARQLSSPDKDFTAYINLIPKAASYDYEVVSFDDKQEKVVHAIGSLVLKSNQDSNKSEPRYFELEAVRSRCPSIQSHDEVYRQIIAEGLQVGPTFMPMHEILLNQEEALATLILPDSVKENFEDYVLHPTLLTGVFQTALISNRFSDNNQAAHFIPMGIDELELYAPVTDRCIIYSKSSKSNADLKKYDLLVCREDGLVAASLKGFAIRALKSLNKTESLNTGYPELTVIKAEDAGRELAAATYRYIKELLSKHIGLSVDEINNEEAFEAYGINSVMIVELNKTFEDAFGPLSKTIFFEYRNTAELAEYFMENHAEKLHGIIGFRIEQAAISASKTLIETQLDIQKIELKQSNPQSVFQTNLDAENEINQLPKIQGAAQAYIKQLMAGHVGMRPDEIDSDEAFESYGINSVMIVEMNKSFEDSFGSLSKTLFFEYRTVQELAEYFIENHADKLRDLLGASIQGKPSETTFNRDAVGANPPNIETDYNPELPSELKALSKEIEPQHIIDDIAIIGVDGRYPGANNVPEFWETLKNGIDCVTEISDSHFAYKNIFDADPEQNKIYSKHGAFIDDIDKFDAAFFNISPREAELIDPQERLFLQVAWGAIEDAGYSRQALLQSSGGQVGVFVGAIWQPYQALGTEETLKGNIIAPSGLLYSIANRVSYFMNFSGPSFVIDSACSSSLTAVHLACQSIISGDCKMALAGGVNLSLHSSKYLFLAQNRFLSTDGRCRSFGDGGDGYVPGEGIGAIVLKPLSQAVKDGDQIYAVIKGSAINHGGKTNGYTVPCPKAQAKMIKQVHQKSGIDPRTISYIEAHGTGTPLGDPIEITGLQKAFEESTKDKQFCAIGSVKSNIGHLEAAAGVASITKVILQMKYGQLVPSIHSDKLNPNIDFAKTPFKVQHELSQWPQPILNIAGASQIMPRRAGISSFGAGGSNAHLLLEEFEQKNSARFSPERGRNVMIVLSAKNEDRLRAMAGNLLNTLEQLVLTGSLDSIAYTLQLGREAMNERLGIVVDSIDALKNKLMAYLANEKKVNGLYTGNVEKYRDTLVALDDEDIAGVIELWVDKAKFNKLLELWVKGFNFDWNKLYGNNPPQRISLPTYPFAKEHYWIPLSKNEQTANTTGLAQLHPLVHENRSSFSQQRFKSEFTGNEFFLNDHIVGTNKVLPAVAYIEMFRAAASLSSDGLEPLKLYDLTWLKPITIGEKPEQILVEISVEDDEFILKAIVENNGKQVVHAQGHCLYLDSDASANPLTPEGRICIDEVNQRLEQYAHSIEIYHLFHQKGLNLQASFQGLEWIKWNEHQALGKITLPSNLSAQQRDVYKIHPSLLDSALQTALFVLETARQKEGALYLPFSMDEVDVLSPLPNTFYSLVQPSDNKFMGDSQHPVRCFDVTVLDTEGTLLLKVKNISFRETKLSLGNIQNQAKPQPSPLITYASPTWTEMPIEEVTSTTFNGTGIVVISNNELRLEQFRTQLAQAKGDFPIFEAVLSDGLNQQKDGKFYISRNEQEGYVEFVSFLDKTRFNVSHLVYLWDSTQLEETQGLFVETERALAFLLQLHKPLLSASNAIKQVFVNVWEPGTSQWLLEGGIVGFLRSVSAEYPKITNKVVSVEAKGKDPGAWLNCLVDELRFSNDTTNTWIRYKRNGTRRLIWGLQPLPDLGDRHSLPINFSALKEGGTYLISGGLGGIGRIIARHLAHNYHANLILLGRSAIAKSSKDYIQNLEAMGAKASYYQVDICDFDNLKGAVAQAKMRFGTIDGIIHSAGVIEDNLIKNKSIDSIKKVIDPKLQGTVYLDLVTQLEPLDFFLAFSSLTAILGNAGQCDYGAANGFMDAFMAHRDTLVGQQARQGLSLSINWPFWSEGQMGQEHDVHNLLDESFGLPLDTNEGIQCLEDSLHLAKNQLVVVKKQNEVSEVANIQETMDSAKPIRKDERGLVIGPTDVANRLWTDIEAIIVELGKFKSGQITAFTDFMALGLESVDLAKLSSKLNKKYALKLSPALFFEHTNLQKLNTYLLDEYSPKIIAHYEQALGLDHVNLEKSDLGAKTGVVKPSLNIHDAIILKGFNKSLLKSKQATKQQDNVGTLPYIFDTGENITEPNFDKPVSDIAVIGMDCVFPGAPDLDAFWKQLVNCESAASEVPPGRWDWREYYGDPNLESNKTNIKWGCFVEDIDKFDASFFNISPREAALMDPQQRLLLQSVWKAIEQAGYAPMELSKSHKVGFFVGVSGNDYYESLMNHEVEAYSSTGGAHSIAANRVSYYFDFKGPSIAVDTACSSSLVALDMAVQALKNGSCDIAITGGVNALISPNLFISFSKAGMLSPTGNISPLDKKANGYVRGEGVGIVVLKRLDRSIKDQDEILALIKGTSVNHGGKVASLTVPNPNAQSELVLDACTKANIDITTLSYIEMHGTGTPLGDPVEVNGLKNAFNAGQAIKQDSYCGIASVKGNIGHLEAAAGVAGVIKTVLALKAKVLPGQCHFEELNPHIELANTPFFVVKDTQAWKQLTDENGEAIPRRAGVSSFGFGGANSHVVIQEYIQSEAEAITPNNYEKPYLMVFSAKTEEQLNTLAKKFVDYLSNNENLPVNLNAMAYTLQVSRTAMTQRLGIRVKTSEELREKLIAFVNGEKFIDGLYSGQAESNSITLNEWEGEKSALVDNWLRTENFDALLSNWVKGENIVWGKLYGNRVPRRALLPTYPFAKTRYWITDSNKQKLIEHANNQLGKKPSMFIDASEFKENQGNEPVVTPYQFLGKSDLSVQIPPAMLREKSVHYFKQMVASILQMPADKIDPSRSLQEYGMDSILVMQTINCLNRYFTEINSTLLQERRTIDALVDYVMTNQTNALIRLVGLDNTQSGETEGLRIPVKVQHKTDCQIPLGENEAIWVELAAPSLHEIANAVSENKVNFKDALRLLKHGEMEL